MVNKTGLESLRDSRHNADAPKRTEILVAVLRLLNRVGYQEMTMEDLAREAQVNKTTLYRWWPGKPAVVADALAALMSVGPIPDTGTTRGDFVAMAKITVANYGQSALGATLPTLISDLTADPEGLAQFRASFVEARREACLVLFERAVERGDLPATANPDVIMDMMAGAIFYRRLVTGGSVDDQLADDMVDLVLGITAAAAAGSN